METLRAGGLTPVALPDGVELRRAAAPRLSAAVRTLAIGSTLVVPTVMAWTSAQTDTALIVTAASLSAFVAYLAAIVLHIKSEVYDAPPYQRVRHTLRIERAAAEGYRDAAGGRVFTVDGARIASPFVRVVVTGSVIVMRGANGLGSSARPSYHVALVFRDVLVRVASFPVPGSALDYGHGLSTWLGAPFNQVAPFEEPAVEHSGAAMVGPMLLLFVDPGVAVLLACVSAGVSGGWRGVAMFAAMCAWASAHVLAHGMNLRALRAALAGTSAQLRSAVASLDAEAPEPEATADTAAAG